MPDKVLSSFLVAEALFVATGGLIIGIVLVTKEHGHHSRTTADVASNLLLMQTPLSGAIFNAGLIFFTFFVSLPGVVLPLPSSRTWLKFHAGLVVACAIVTLALGLRVWLLTLQTRSNLGLLWVRESRENQSILQQKFRCCGYFDNKSFQKDRACSSAAAASRMQTCMGPFTSFANDFFDIVFTSMFGFVALDVILCLCTAMVLKTRAEKERYRYIDEKIRPAGFRLERSRV